MAGGTEVGQVFRDTYYDGKLDNCTKRTVRILQVGADSVLVEQVTDVRGEAPKGKARRTTISFKTLAKGFVLSATGSGR